MATKFFSDGAVHAYFNPYETPYDAFMNYMNVLSDFEIRLRKYFPDTAEQDMIYKLGSQLIERDMIIEKQTYEIAKLTRKSSKKKVAEKPKLKKTAKPKSKTVEKELPASSSVKPVKKSLPKLKKPETKTKTKKKTTPVKRPGKAKGSK